MKLFIRLGVINISVLGFTVAVALLTFYHFTLGKYLNDFAIDNNQKTSKFFRIYNEIPTIILILVIFVVVFKPL